MHITIPIKHGLSNTTMSSFKSFIVVLTVKLYHAMAGFDVLRNMLVGHGFALVSHKAGNAWGRASGEEGPPLVARGSYPCFQDDGFEHALSQIYSLLHKKSTTVGGFNEKAKALKFGCRFGS